MSDRYRDAYLGTLAQLVAFIGTNHTFTLPSDAQRPDTAANGWVGDREHASATLAGILRGQERDGDSSWETKAKALELFLRKAPLMVETFQAIAFAPSNLSRRASYDPLTLQGLEDVLHFVNNGVLDDWWLAHYRLGGERRIVNEVVDDAIQLGHPVQGEPYGRQVDKPDAWFREARRDVLSERTFETVFAEDLADVSPRVPTQEDLMELWMARPYDDMVAAPAP